MSTSTIVLIIMLFYFGALFIISHFSSRSGEDNKTFFLGNRQSKWWVVAIAMISSSISGVTFISVPGMVGLQNMSYLQMVFGFFFGYLIVAFVLLPLYYKLNLISIYGYLKERYGQASYRTGASFFILAKMLLAATRLYLVVTVLYTLIFSAWNIPFSVIVCAIVLMIWAYTRKSGVKTIIWTDLLQTVSLVVTLCLIIWQVTNHLNLDFSETINLIKANEHSRIFVFDDWRSPQNFFKQFISGIFIVVVMTGLDQAMMQKNLSCRNLKESQRNMISYGLTFAPINLLFLTLGILLLVFAQKENITLPPIADQIMPMLASEHLGLPVLIFFTLGITATSFSSADSALTSITTSVCVDLLETEKKDEKLAVKKRKQVHLIISILFAIIILVIAAFKQDSIIMVIYTLASYTYGPLLGLFAFGLLTKNKVKDSLVPYVCVLSPILCLGVEILLRYSVEYKVGYEILLINAGFTIAGLIAIRKK